MLSWTWPVTHISSTRRVEITSLDDCQLSPLTSAERLQSLWEPLPMQPCLYLLPASCHFRQHTGGLRARSGTLTGEST